MELTEQEKMEINAKSVKSILDCSKLAGVDFWNLPKNMRSLIVAIYQQAVKDFTKYLSETELTK